MSVVLKGISKLMEIAEIRKKLEELGQEISSFARIYSKKNQKNEHAAEAGPASKDSIQKINLQIGNFEDLNRTTKYKNKYLKCCRC